MPIDAASIVAGEAPVGMCGWVGALLVLNVLRHNPVFYGRGTPTWAETWITENFARFPDISGNAHFLFSLQDLQTEYVRNLLSANPDLAVSAVVRCRGGLALFAFARDPGGMYACIPETGDTGSRPPRIGDIRRNCRFVVRR